MPCFTFHISRRILSRLPAYQRVIPSTLRSRRPQINRPHRAVRKTPMHLLSYLRACNKKYTTKSSNQTMRQRQCSDTYHSQSLHLRGNQTPTRAAGTRRSMDDAAASGLRRRRRQRMGRATGREACFERKRQAAHAERTPPPASAMLHRQAFRIARAHAKASEPPPARASPASARGARRRRGAVAGGGHLTMTPPSSPDRPPPLGRPLGLGPGPPPEDLLLHLSPQVAAPTPPRTHPTPPLPSPPAGWGWGAESPAESPAEPPGPAPGRKPTQAYLGNAKEGAERQNFPGEGGRGGRMGATF